MKEETARDDCLGLFQDVMELFQMVAEDLRQSVIDGLNGHIFDQVISNRGSEGLSFERVFRVNVSAVGIHNQTVLDCLWKHHRNIS